MAVPLPYTIPQAKRLDQAIHFEADTPINDTLNLMVRLIELRLVTMEEVKTILDRSVDELTEVALARLNETFTPLILDAQRRLQEFGANFEATSSTSLIVGTGNKIIQLAEEDRDGFVFSDYISIRHTGGTEVMTGTVTNYDRATGQLFVNVVDVLGSGTFNAWSLRMSVPPDLTHSGRTDNPHQVTAAQVGAYTKVEADAQLTDLQEDQTDVITSAYKSYFAQQTTSYLRYDVPQPLTALQRGQVQQNIAPPGIPYVLATANDPAVVARVIGARGPKNLIINPSFQVSQLATTGNFAASNAWPDGFSLVNNTNAAGTMTQVSGTRSPEGSINRWRIAVTNADTTIAIGEYSLIRSSLEGYDVAHLCWGTPSARPVLVRFGIKPPTSGTISIVLRNGAHASMSYVHPITFAVEDVGKDKIVSFMVPGPTTGTWYADNRAGLYIDITLACGSTYSTTNVDTWQAAHYLAVLNQHNGVGAIWAWEFFDFGLYDPTGMVAGQVPLFEIPNYADELRRCKRYVQIIDVNHYIFQGDGNAYAELYLYPVEMRTSPSAGGSISYYGAAGGFYPGYPAYGFAPKSWVGSWGAYSPPTIIGVYGYWWLYARL